MSPSTSSSPPLERTSDCLHLRATGLLCFANIPTHAHLRAFAFAALSAQTCFPPGPFPFLIFKPVLRGLPSLTPLPKIANPPLAFFSSFSHLIFFPQRHTTYLFHGLTSVYLRDEGNITAWYKLGPQKSLPNDFNRRETPLFPGSPLPVSSVLPAAQYCYSVKRQIVSPQQLLRKLDFLEPPSVVCRPAASAPSGLTRNAESQVLPQTAFHQASGGAPVNSWQP